MIGYPGIPPGAPDRPQAAVKGVSFAWCRLISPLSSLTLHLGHRGSFGPSRR